MAPLPFQDTATHWLYHIQPIYTRSNICDDIRIYVSRHHTTTTLIDDTPFAEFKDPRHHLRSMVRSIFIPTPHIDTIHNHNMFTHATHTISREGARGLKTFAPHMNDYGDHPPRRHGTHILSSDLTLISPCPPLVTSLPRISTLIFTHVSRMLHIFIHVRSVMILYVSLTRFSYVWHEIISILLQTQQVIINVRIILSHRNQRIMNGMKQ